MHHFHFIRISFYPSCFRIKICTQDIDMPVQQKKIINLLGKKNTGKKTPKEDSELGYSDITLALTFNLPYPQQKYMQCPQCIKKNLNSRVVGEANLGREVLTISKLVGTVPRNPLPL